MRIIVLFNLRPGVDEATYEKWAREEDMAAVAKMKSVDSFTVHRAKGVLGTDKPSPYRYIEVVDVNDEAMFGEEVATETMKKIAARFQELGDNPTFILTEPVGAKA
jgi:hypothetical protein